MRQGENTLRLTGIILAILLLISVVALILVHRHRKEEATRDHVQITENVIDSRQVAASDRALWDAEGWSII